MGLTMIICQKKRHKCARWFRAIFAILLDQITDVQMFPSTGGGVSYEFILLVLLFVCLDIRGKETQVCLSAEINEAML